MEQENRIYTIPNLLTFFRLCLIPILVWLYCVEENLLWTAAVLLLSGLTDVEDKLTQGAMLLIHLAWQDIPMGVSAALIVGCVAAVLVF